jgi:chlorite dismutase
MVRPYTLMGTRADADFMLWLVSDSLDSFQALSTQIMSTMLGRHLATPYSYLAMTRKSVYVDRHQHPGQEGSRLAIRPRGTKYLFVYPFVKSREWYLLPLEKRQEMMNTHIAIGHKFPSVKINTSYSFGLDDQDFVVSFESDKPGDFLDLVMALRETEGSKYTVRDTPIFTCTAMDMRQVLESLGE